MGKRSGQGLFVLPGLAAMVCIPAIAFGARRVAPTARTGKPTDIEPVGAILSGSINPHGRRVHYRFEYGRKRVSEHHSGVSEELVIGNEPVKVEEVIEGLHPGVEYRYRLVALYAHRAKSVRGTVRSFTTNCYFKTPAGKTVLGPCR